MQDSLDKRSLLGMARYNSRARLASVQQAVSIVHSQTAGGLRVGRMACVTSVHKHRANFLLEERDVFGWSAACTAAAAISARA
ncbi:MAG TPA: hypothetical protein VE621_12550 [Bryobacteraceae bacterium]|jgi:hypothetical protein|nr:hypothetical protein [Bryobacteraceae bacterium]